MATKRAKTAKRRYVRRVDKMAEHLSTSRKVETLQIVAGIFREAAATIDATLEQAQTKIRFAKASKRRAKRGSR